MRVEAKTKSGIRIHLEKDNVKKQTRVESASASTTFFRVEMADGSRVDLSESLSGVPIETSPPQSTPPKVEKKGSYTENLTKRLLQAKDIPSVQGRMNPPGKKRTADDDEKYKGEMVFTHKTSPEIAIYSKDKVVKDVDIKTMYKRR